MYTRYRDIENNIVPPKVNTDIGGREGEGNKEWLGDETARTGQTADSKSADRWHLYSSEGTIWGVNNLARELETFLNASPLKTSSLPLGRRKGRTEIDSPCVCVAETLATIERTPMVTPFYCKSSLLLPHDCLQDDLPRSFFSRENWVDVVPPPSSPSPSNQSRTNYIEIYIYCIVFIEKMVFCNWKKLL